MQPEREDPYRTSVHVGEVSGSRAIPLLRLVRSAISFVLVLGGAAMYGMLNDQTYTNRLVCLELWGASAILWVPDLIGNLWNKRSILLTLSLWLIVIHLGSMAFVVSQLGAAKGFQDRFNRKVQEIRQLNQQSSPHSPRVEAKPRRVASNWGKHGTTAGLSSSPSCHVTALEIMKRTKFGLAASG